MARPASPTSISPTALSSDLPTLYTTRTIRIRDAYIPFPQKGTTLARLHTVPAIYHTERLLVEVKSASLVCASYVPMVNDPLETEEEPDSSSANPVQLIQIDGQDRSITMYPVNTRPSHRLYLQPKYDQVTTITLHGAPLTYIAYDPGPTSQPKEVFRTPYFGTTKPVKPGTEIPDTPTVVPSTPEEVVMVLEGLPKGFLKDYEYGLGLNKRYRFIVEAVEQLSTCTTIVISTEYFTSVDDQNQTFFISMRDFREAMADLDRNTRRARAATRSINAHHVSDYFARKTRRENTTPLLIGTDSTRRLLFSALQGKNVLSTRAQTKVLDVVSDNTAAIADRQPEKLTKLKNEIEFVNLRRLIKRYSTMMQDERTAEWRWQTLLQDNPFILSLVFGYPVILVQAQASVGGRRLSGRGGKVADFLVRNGMTGNTAIVEIKTPKSELLAKKQVNDGVYGPSAALSRAVAQVLDQRYRYEREFNRIKATAETSDLEAYAIHCGLIVGVMPSDRAKRKSVELYRRNSKDVEIITFDELLTKLQNLETFLVADEAPLSDDDLPF